MKLLLFIALILLFINNYPDKDITLENKIHEDGAVTIYNGYLILNINHMIQDIGDIERITIRHRSYLSLIGEWYCHNICYYIIYFLTDVLEINSKFLYNIKERARNVDLENF